MATVTHRSGVADTANVESYVSASVTPAVGDLLVVAVLATATVDAGDVTVSANGVTSFTRVDRATSSVSQHSEYWFVADQLTTGTASMTVTFDCTGDAATGAVVHVASVAGMSKVGAAAIRQSTKIDNGVGATTPVFTFDAACLTGNVTLTCLGEISAGGIGVPTGWTEGNDLTFGTPTWGGHYTYRNSGFTGTTITYPGNETAHGGVAVELDTSTSAIDADASLTAASTLTATAVRAANADSAVTATAARTATAALTAAATATQTATAAHTATATLTAATTATLAGTATLTATATVTRAATATLTVTADRTATVVRAANADAALTVTATRTAAATGTWAAAAALTGTATITATGDVPGGGSIDADASLAATATLTATAAVTQVATASLTGSATITATASVTRAATASLTVTADRTAAATRAANTDATLTVTSTRTAAATGVFVAQASLTATATITADADVPSSLWGPPPNLTATPISLTQIDLAWDAVVGASGYDIERDGVVVATDVVGTSYSDTGLTAATEYDYRARSVRA